MSAINQPSIHQKFSWFDSRVCAFGEAEFLGRVYDICQGAKTVLEVVHRDTIEVEHNQAPIMSPQDTERLMLFTTAALSMLGQMTFERIEVMNNSAMENAQ